MTFLYYANELPAGSQDTIVLMRYSDDMKTAAVIEKRFGDGRVVLVTNCAGDEPANKWNNWNKYQFFPILLGETLSYLGQSSKTKMNYMVGEVYQRLLSMSEWASEVYIVPPTGESIPKNLTKMGEEEGGLKEEDEDETRFLLTHADTNTAGVYRVAFTGRQNVPGVAERTENFAVNVDTRESDMTKLVWERFRHTIQGAESAVRTAAPGQKEPPASDAYTFNELLLDRVLYGRSYCVLVGSRSLAPDFLWNPAERLFFVQDLMFMLRAFATEEPALFAAAQPAAATKG